jgi:hypothetical protein
MHRKTTQLLFSVILLAALILPACSTFAPPPTPTSTPQPTATNTITLTPTITVTPSRTPRPTVTPNFAATERAGEIQAEVQDYYDKGYITTTEGKFRDLDEFTHEWAQLGWYDMMLVGSKAADFFISAHFNWSSAYQNADTSGCGYVFSLQEDGDHYAIFLDRSEILFLITSNQRGRHASPTRGSGKVKFGNPAEADFTTIVKGNYVYALVDGEVAGEYTLAQSRSLTGDIALTVLSGTNKDYGTRCEMTNLHIWTPK